MRKFAARFQIIVTIAKLITCFLIIFTGLYYYIFKSKLQKRNKEKTFFLDCNESFKNLMQNSNTNAGDLSMALYGGLYAYSGWDILNYGTNEIKKPKKFKKFFKFIYYNIKLFNSKIFLYYLFIFILNLV